MQSMALSLQQPAHAGSSLTDFSTLKMEAIRYSETSVRTRSTWRNIPENGILHSHRHENLKSYIITMLLLVTNSYHFQRYVSGHVVMMKEPVAVAPMFQSFSSHIFSQASQNVTIKVRVDHSVMTNKFTVNSPLHMEKNKLHALC
jgi:hypothetical protein